MKRNYAKEFAKRVKEHKKHPQWWIEGIRLHLGEIEAELLILEKILTERDREEGKE